MYSPFVYMHIVAIDGTIIKIITFEIGRAHQCLYMYKHKKVSVNRDSTQLLHYHDYAQHDYT